MDGWVTVIVSCGECLHTWTELLPADWDGSPRMCSFCGELDGVVAEGRGN